MAKAKKPAPRTAARQAPKVTTSHAPKKKYVKGRPVCKVTFSLPAPEARQVCLVGEFNAWAHDATPMKKQKSGVFTATVDLETGRAYRYRYFIDGLRYENDYCADWYDPNPYGGDDSVVNV